MLILGITFTALTLESLKFLFFFRIHLCHSPVWQQFFNTFKKPLTCSRNRGSYASIACFLLYSISLILVIVAIWFGFRDNNGQVISNVPLTMDVRNNGRRYSSVKSLSSLSLGTFFLSAKFSGRN